tara:strand:- start:790 stop:1725 length:936 start_codon:yes stop_codon:yes gene_type:complete
MVAMEKITYGPLIQHLRANQEEYNMLLTQHELKYNYLPKEEIKQWMLEFVQPIVEDISKDDKIIIGHVTKVFFKQILILSVGDFLNKNYDDIKRLWSLFAPLKRVSCLQPEEVFKVLKTTYSNLQNHNKKKIELGLSLLEIGSKKIETIDQLKAFCKCTLWICGLAHLREQSIISYSKLPDYLKEILSENNPLKISLKDAFSTPWNHPKHLKNELGGFVGFEGGVFTNPPTVAKIQSVILATDGTNVSALYIDVFGISLLNNVSFNPNTVIDHSKKGYASLFQDVSSEVRENNILIFTRESSHKIFIQTRT